MINFCELEKPIVVFFFSIIVILRVTAAVPYVTCSRLISTCRNLLGRYGKLIGGLQDNKRISGFGLTKDDVTNMFKSML